MLFNGHLFLTRLEENVFLMQTVTYHKYFKTFWKTCWWEGVRLLSEDSIHTKYDFESAIRALNKTDFQSKKPSKPSMTGGELVWEIVVVVFVVVLVVLFIGIIACERMRGWQIPSWLPAIRIPC